MKLKSLFVAGVLAVSSVVVPISAVNAEYGGDPSRCSYISNEDRSSYSFSCYPSTGQSPSNHAFKQIRSTDPVFTLAKYAVDIYSRFPNYYYWNLAYCVIRNA